MSDRLTALDVSVFQLGGVSFLGDTKSWDFNIPVDDDDCRVAEDRYHASIPVKKALEFSIERIPHVSTICQSGLNISVYTVGGTSFLAQLESGSLTVTTDVVDGSGVADIWKWPNSVGTDVEIQTNHFVTTNAALFQLAAANNITSIQVEVVITIPDVCEITLPMTMTAAGHKIESGQLQMQNCTFKLRGEPSSVDGDPMLIEILTGDAYLSWNITTDGGIYSGNAIITQTALNFNNAALLSMTHALANQGAPSYTAQ